MNLFKRALSALLLVCLLLPVCVTAEEDPFGDTIVIDTAEAQSGEEEFYIPDDEEMAKDIEILDDERDESVDPNKLDLNENLPDHIVNILLVGIDGRTEDMDSKNSTQHGDVQIVVSINKKDGSIKLTSIMRDLYVKIPGYKSKNRINAAYSKGGGQLAMRTVNNLLQLNIQHYVTINFYGLASIIDSLGGIDIDLTAKEAKAINDYINKNLKKSGYDNQDKDYERQPLKREDGVQHLDGIQAVMYARLRSNAGGDGDFTRTARQRHLLELLLKKVLQDGLNPRNLINLLATCLPYAKTNMSLKDLGALATGVLNSGIVDRMNSGEALLEQFRVPMGEYGNKEVKPTWRYTETSGGASVISFLTASMNGQQVNTEAVHNFIYGEYIPAK
ncbi:MAG: LCP family protein [Clostridia bacterium]|nr:LCP family protein [Clostridia bacterium]